MKKKKLNLDELHVKSFITETDSNNIKGGATEGCGNTFDYYNTVPINQCNIGSYNAACPTVPVQDCNVNLKTKLCVQTEV